MTPKLGETHEAVVRSHAEREASARFEDFLRASGMRGEFEVAFGTSLVEVEAHKIFIGLLSEFTQTDLEQAESDVEVDPNIRFLDISGVILIEEADVDSEGIIQGVTYEALYPEQVERLTPAPLVTRQLVTVDPFVEV